MECQGDQLNDSVALEQILIFAPNRSDRRDGLMALCSGIFLLCECRQKVISPTQMKSIRCDSLETIIRKFTRWETLPFAFLPEYHRGFSAAKPQTTQILQI